MTTIVIGIDPGISGACALLTEQGLQACVDIPIMVRAQSRVRRKGGEMRDKVTNQVDGAGLATLLREWTNGHDKNEVLVVIEKCQAMPGKIKGSDKAQSSAGTFSLGLSAGIIEGVVAARGLPHQLVHPATWKAHFKLPTGKDAARSRTIRLYPSAPISRKKDHNRAEAILLARYGQEKHA